MLCLYVPGALYKALACFSLRDIDFCKIESRPTSVDLLQFLKFRSKQQLQQAPSLMGALAITKAKLIPVNDFMSLPTPYYYYY